MPLRFAKAPIAAIAVILASSLVQSPAHASDTLDIQQELSMPGVKLVVVEFYATWCKPCMEAVPKWKALHEKYRKHGLRFIVVSAEGTGICNKPPDWSPDKAVCDEDETIKKQLKVKGLPQSYLYSWQGNLALTSHEVEPIQSAIEAYFKHAQLKLLVDRIQVTGDKCAVGGNPEWLRGFLAGKIREQSKFDVISVSAEALPVKGSSICEPDFPPNSVLRVSLEGDCRGHRSMTLSVEKDGCTLASATESYKGKGLDEDRASMEAAASAGIEKMMNQLVSSRAKKAKLVGKGREGKIGYVEIQEEEEEQAAGEVIVKFESDPVGAVVLVDGEVLCQKTPCSKMVGQGGHKVSMQAENYVKKAGDFSALKGAVVSFKLDPDFGWLTVTSDPTGLGVKLDGEIIGKTPVDKRPLSPKAHDVLVVSDCHYEAGERVIIDRGQERKVSVAPIQKTGKVKVKAQDKNGNDIEADVYVDGQKLGQAPGTLKVSVCSKNIELRTQKGVGYKGSLKVTENQTVELAAAVEEELKGDCEYPEWIYSSPANLFFTESEITTFQYSQCLKYGRCDKSHFSSRAVNDKCNWEHLDRGNHPMNCIDWSGAEEFCKFRGGRLPTDSEWYQEASNKGKREFPWGKEGPGCKHASYMMDQSGAGCGQGTTFKVCSKSAGDSVSGLCDMSGNVWEWTSSTDGSARVVRGGAFDSRGPDQLRTASRDRREQSQKDSPSLGFRCVRDIGKVRNHYKETKGTWIGEQMWQNPPSSQKMQYKEAEKYCQNLRLGGYSDWRLPDPSGDLVEIYAQKINNGCFWMKGLVGPCDYYWGKGDDKKDYTLVMGYSVHSLFFDVEKRKNRYFVRCVR